MCEFLVVLVLANIWRNTESKSCKIYLELDRTWYARPFLYSDKINTINDEIDRSYRNPSPLGSSYRGITELISQLPNSQGDL